MSPIVRRAELRALSSDHHGALVLAFRAKALAQGRPAVGAPATPAAMRDVVLRDFEAVLSPHFRCEEEVLLAAALCRGPKDAADHARVREDHAAIAACVAALRAAVDDASVRAALGRFGSALEVHVRFEEREWFEHLQARLGEDDWAALAPELAARATPASCAARDDR